MSNQDVAQPLLLGEVPHHGSSLISILSSSSPIASTYNWRRRDLPLFLIESIGWILFSVTWAFLFVLPLCGMLFHCNCVWLWDSSESCAYIPRGSTCPFCGGGTTLSVSISLIPQWGVVPVMVAAALLMRYKKPKMYLLRLVVVLVIFFVFVILASLIFELANGYPHFM